MLNYISFNKSPSFSSKTIRTHFEIPLAFAILNRVEECQFNILFYSIEEIKLNSSKVKFYEYLKSFLQFNLNSIISANTISTVAQQFANKFKLYLYFVTF